MTIECLSRNARARERDVQNIAQSVTNELHIRPTDTADEPPLKITIVNEDELEFDIKEFDSVNEIIQRFEAESI